MYTPSPPGDSTPFVNLYNDPLTGLPMRQRLVETLSELFQNGAAASPALVLLDLDRFISINNGYGPDLADALLHRVARRLAGATEGAIMIARVSGDCFGVLVEDSRSALEIAGRAHEFMSRPYAVNGYSISLGVSAGVALAPEDGTDAISLIHSAGLALHQAKLDGGSRLRRFEPAMKTRAFRRQSLEADLRKALALQLAELRRALVSEQFEVHYQPQLTAADRRLTGFEALLRWRHPARGLISPVEFIPIAEEIGLINLLDDWVMRVACRDAVQWLPPPGRPPLRVAVNVSPLQFREGPALLNAIKRALDESGLASGNLELEITETALLCDADGLLDAIKGLGCGLALDDFGTGYSSLARLRDLPFDRMKIDRSFMQTLKDGVPEPTRRCAFRMVRAIASLGSGLGLTTIAEGIETEQQASIAFDAGCTEMQGFLFSPALPPDEIAGFILRMDSGAEKIEHV